MADIKISELPAATSVGNSDIFVMDQSATTKTASRSLIVAGLATTAQVAAITPASIGALATSQAGSFASTQQIQGLATTAQVAAITPASIGALSTAQAGSFATTQQIQGFATTAQIAAITPASIGAASTLQIQGLATTADVAAITPSSIGALATSQAGSFIATSALSYLATTAQVSAITPNSIGAMATSERGSYTTTAAFAALTPASIGAASTLQIQGLATTLDVASITPASIGAIPTSQLSTLAKLDNSGILVTNQLPALNGDISMLAGSVTAQVVGLQGHAISSVTPTNGQTLQWNNSAWVPGAVPTGGSGGGGVTFYLNFGTAADNPITGLPITPNVPYELGRVSNIAQTTYTSGVLSEVNYDLVAGFVTDVLDPDTISLPAGLWDFNIWASSNANSANQTIMQLRVYKYDGTTPTLLATSDDVSVYDPTVVAQYIMSVVVPQTTLALNDRLYIELRAKATTNNRTITFKFGDGTPAHVHTTLPSVGGSGSVFVVNGVFQSPARLIVDTDIATNAAIALDKINGAASVASVDVVSSAIHALTPASIGAASTLQIQGFATTSQVAAITPDSIGAIATTALSYLATTAQVAAITPSSIGAASTLQIQGLATTTQVAAITPASIGALATSQAGSFIATTALSYLATTSQVAAITPNSIGAMATSERSSYISTAQIGAYATTAQIPALPVAIINGGTGSTTAAAALTALGAAPITPGTSTQADGVVLALGDANSTVTITSASPATVTVPLDSSVPFPVGTQIIVRQQGLGQITFVPASGVTFEANAAAYTTSNRFAMVSLIKTGTDTWALGGDLTPSALTVAQGGTGANNAQDALYNLGSPFHYVTLRSSAAQTPLSLAGPYTATWSTASTTVTLATGDTTLLAQGMTFSTTGLTNCVIISITNSTQFVVSQVPSTTQASAASITIHTTTPTTFTYPAGVQAPLDGYQVVVGDIVAFTSQTPTATNGPWVCTVAGAVGVSQVMTRPSWFTGTSPSILISSLKGTTAQGSIASITSGTAGNTDIAVGLQSLGAHNIYQRGTVPTLTSNTFTGKQTFAVNSTGTATAGFNVNSSQPLMTAPTAGSIEWDGKLEYVSESATFTATISGTTMTVTGTPVGILRIGMYISGTGVTAAQITALGTGVGGTGTYTISVSQTVGSATTITGALRKVNISAIQPLTTAATHALTTTSLGALGQTMIDSTGIYYCIAPNSWRKAAFTLF